MADIRSLMECKNNESKIKLFVILRIYQDAVTYVQLYS